MEVVRFSRNFGLVVIKSLRGFAQPVPLLLSGLKIPKRPHLLTRRFSCFQNLLLAKKVFRLALHRSLQPNSTGPFSGCCIVCKHICYGTNPATSNVIGQRRSVRQANGLVDAGNLLR